MRKNTNVEPFLDGHSEITEKNIFLTPEKKAEIDDMGYEWGSLLQRDNEKKIDQFLFSISGIYQRKE